jgi:exodeoxyribonuclease-5
MELEPAPPSTPVVLFELEDDAQIAHEIPVPTVAGTSQHGIILHKLMEEVLTEETSAATSADLRQRAAELVAQLGLEPVSDPSTGIAPAELAGTIERTLALPEIAQLRDRLVPEHSVFGHENTTAGEIFVAGVADAVALGADSVPETIVDWKSDIAPSHSNFEQIKEYCQHTGAKRALLVLMTPGKILEWSNHVGSVLQPAK